MKSDGTVEHIAGPWSLAQELAPWRESSDKHLLPDTTLPSPLPPPTAALYSLGRGQLGMASGRMGSGRPLGPCEGLHSLRASSPVPEGR